MLPEINGIPKVRQYSTIDVHAFKKDVKNTLTSVLPPSVQQLNSALRSVLDHHAPLAVRHTSRDHPSPWYKAVGTVLRQAKRERRKAERKWRSTLLQVDKQIFQIARCRVTNIVKRAKTNYRQSKNANCTTLKQLYHGDNFPLAAF